MPADEEQTSPISCPVNVSRLPARGMPVRIEPDALQRARLAEVHDLVSVESFLAELLVSTWKAGGVRVSGSVTAAIVQSCIVTLEPIEAEIAEDVTALFAPEGSRLLRPDRDEGGEILLDVEGPDAPEPFSGHEIDVGALAEEFFALGIDPYPRKAGASIEPGAGDDDARRGPLHERLKSLKNRD